MARTVIALGANIGKKRQNLISAVKYIQGFGKIKAISSLYKTSAYGLTDQPDFLNSVLILETDLDPIRLLEELKNIEKRIGRKKRIRWGPREIDLDIILYDELVLRESELIIPHSDFHNRTFVLQPLAEIQPDMKSPVPRGTIQQLLESCRDQTKIKKLDREWYPHES